MKPIYQWELYQKFHTWIFNKTKHWQNPQISKHAYNLFKHRFAFSIANGYGVFKSIYYTIRYPHI